MRPRRCIGRKIFYTLFAAGYLPALLLVAYGALWLFGGRALTQHSPGWIRPYLASLRLIGEPDSMSIMHRKGVECTLIGPSFPSSELITEEINAIHGRATIQYYPRIPHGSYRMTICYDPNSLMNKTQDELLDEVMKHEIWPKSPDLPPRPFTRTATGSFWNGNPVGEWTFRDDTGKEIGTAKIAEPMIVFQWNTECKSSASETIRKIVEDSFTIMILPEEETPSWDTDW